MAGTPIIFFRCRDMALNLDVICTGKAQGLSHRVLVLGLSHDTQSSPNLTSLFGLDKTLQAYLAQLHHFRQAVLKR